MITAIDTNILLDILIADKMHFANSKNLIDMQMAQGQLIISEVVYAELASQFGSGSELKDFLSSTSIKPVPSNEKALVLAGERWKVYSRRKKKELQCPECGKFITAHCESCHTVLSFRQRIVSDFMIGAHALVHAQRLLSRDRGFYKTYFKDVDVKSH